MSVWRRASRSADALLADVAAALTALFPQRLASLVLFGSVARGERAEARSDLNLLIVLDVVNPSTLEEVRQAWVRLRDRRLVPPVVVEEKELHRQSTVFALEFADIQASYRVLAGRDVVKSLRVQSADLQSQLRHEVHRAILRLRQGYVELGGHADQLRQHLLATYRGARALVAGYARLTGAQAVGPRAAHVAHVAKIGAIRQEVWDRTAAADRGDPLSDPDLRFLYGDFLHELERLAEHLERPIRKAGSRR